MPPALEDTHKYLEISLKSNTKQLYSLPKGFYNEKTVNKLEEEQVCIRNFGKRAFKLTVIVDHYIESFTYNIILL